MDYVASEELGNLARFGFIREMDFTYVVRSVQYITILLKHVQRTIDDVPDSWARVLCGDGLAGVKLSESCQQIVRFIGRDAFIEPLDLQVFVLIVRAALDASLGSFDELQQGKLCLLCIIIIR